MVHFSENRSLFLPRSSVYKEYGGQLVIIELESGGIFYFSASTTQVVKFFAVPRTLGQFLMDKTEEEKAYLRTFCDYLIEKQILRFSEEEGQNAPIPESLPRSYERPILIKEELRKLDDISFLSP